MTSGPALAVVVALCGFGLTACAGTPVPQDGAERCRTLIDRVDRRIDGKGVRDAETARVKGFPYLRVNRFLSSFRADLREDPEAGGAFGDWVRRLRVLDREARQVELQNLGAVNIAASVDACAETLLADEQDRPGFRAALTRAARVPSSYDDAVRAAGLYPVTQIGVALGFERWKDENLGTFAEAPDTWAANETVYGLLPGEALGPDEAAALIDLASNNALSIPDISGAVLSELASAYAPVIAVEAASGADRIGRPYWPAVDSTAPATDPADPVIYIRLAHTRFGGEILPQLVYTVWFPARPKTGPLDILGGALDGFVWRVTLSREGRPLVYDTFHACGCYHLFFPVPPVVRTAVPEDDDLREEPLVPRAAPLLEPGERLVLHLAPGSHYLRNLSVAGKVDPDRRLRLVDEAAAPEYGLRSLAQADGTRRSLFGPDGIVPGTARAERFLLWPMGIASPGAMRQWGTHATAFVGTRHADDPFLFDKAFAR
ncbi:MAG: hypothetical protein RLO08_02545 [Parvibaculaceae bacterium]